MQGTEKTLEVNNYTFHRHSAPKNIVYYRCSDKRCRARLHFNLLTKDIVMKHTHLDPTIHQKPRFNKSITVDQLATIPQTKRGNRHTPAPVRTTEPLMRSDSELMCSENFLLPVKRPRYITMINAPSTDVLMVRFTMTDKMQAEGFCRSVVKKGVASKAFYHSSGSVFWLLNGEVAESPQTGVVECEVPAYQFDNFKELTGSFLGSELKLSTFRLA